MIVIQAIDTEASLLAVFATGLLGGVHCAGMCGGIVSALGALSTRRQQGVQTPLPSANATPLRAFPVPVRVSPTASAGAPATLSGTRSHAAITLLCYNTGRLLTYTILGALAGGIGSLAWWLDNALPVQQTAWMLTNIMLIVLGLYLTDMRWIVSGIERLGTAVWAQLQPGAARRMGQSGIINALSAGALWGMVPCGMVYAVLGIALLSGSAVNGAIYMLVFGLGTLPNLLLLGWSGQWLTALRRHRPLRVFMGLLIIGFGLAGLLH